MSHTAVVAASTQPYLIILFIQASQHGVPLSCCICWCGCSSLHNYVGELLAPSAPYISSVLLQLLKQRITMLFLDIWISVNQYHKVAKYV